ncbi:MULTISPECIES: glycerol dehydratase reactivase beta/small subunit family protein [unclassified Halanaerobium]|uniref:glycerol dehydratase reactivase beta/small subunit family protein n=1 Tax=unclassified Halanaerobium TaxID=2641197 RepID=UPI000DF27CF7|nr:MULTISPECIES: glycerol dehydratase reactivase beta/small subunit family protein [unclassified Halanaerobium]RCW45666.1 dehydratase medium subunit [Halanaerobium sp. MA284_MarDTE_T2]RCW88038.1 dehydratase medium subunit [Halanaerobium sp. DL-01]
MSSKEQSKKPSVYIGFDAEIAGSDIFKNVCYGLEEEGIPFYYFASEEKNPEILAHEAAQRSRLNIGVGIGADNNIVLQHKKLDLENPFFKKKIDYNFQAKIIGSNAARLVKGIPVKEIPLKDEFTTGSAPDIKFSEKDKLEFKHSETDLNADQVNKYSLSDLVLSSKSSSSSENKDQEINTKISEEKNSSKNNEKNSDSKIDEEKDNSEDFSEINLDSEDSISEKQLNLLTDLIVDVVKKLNN